MNERQIFEAAGVSVREANAAKQDLLDRIYDFLCEPDYDPGLTDEILALAAHACSEVMDPDYEFFNPEAHALMLKYEAEYRAKLQAIELAHLSQATGTVPGIALSLEDMSNLSGVPLDQLEEAYETIRPDLATRKAKDKSKTKPAKKKSRKTSK